MSKRKLSKQQQSRIEENQRRELQQSDEQGESLQENCNGRIVSHFGQHLDVETLKENGESRTVRCHQRANLPSLVTGDLVVWEEDEGGSGVIVARGQRNNVFGRHDPQGKLRPVAANIDRVLVVFASAPMPHSNLIDRYLVAIESLGLQPLLILNKIDLLDSENSDDLDNMLSIYEKVGYKPHKVSAESGQGIPELEAELAGLTTVLVGQSGVGKSSLINRLSKQEVAEVGNLSDARYKGTHTTTTSRLFHLGNCDLVDSPGIREFNLDHISPESVFDGFAEFKPYKGQCKFRDCAHQSEPACALLAARDKGEIQQCRVDSYFRILNSYNEPS